MFRSEWVAVLGSRELPEDTGHRRRAGDDGTEEIAPVGVVKVCVH